MLLLQLLGAALALGGIAFLVLAIHHVGRGLPQPPERHWRPPVTIMVPAHGATARLEDCIRSVLNQDYDGFQVVFGLHSASDAARPIIERVMADFPQVDTALVMSERRIGSNPKNANLANMMEAVRHDVVVMVDSDVLVGPDFLGRIVAPLADGAVGGVTCLYSGAPEGGLASRLGAMYHNDWFMPSALVDIARREMDICYGAAIAVRRSALDRIGGFEAMADAVAQDFVLGYELHRHGFKVALASAVVKTVVAEDSLAGLMRHELRWNRAVRAVRPLDHLLSIFMSPLLPAALLLLLSWPLVPALSLLGLLVGLRQYLHRLMRASFDLPKPQPLLLVMREVLNLAVWGRALFGRKVQWAGRVLETGHGLSMTPVERAD
jgi:ceramide glucosyltransferase